MLNKSERFWVLRVIHNFCKFGFLPAQVDLSRWELRPRTHWKYRLSFNLFFLHTLYKIGSLVHAYFLSADTPLHQIVIHIVLAIASPVYSYWYYVLYIKYPNVYRVYLKTTLTGNIDAVDGQKKRSWTRRLAQYTPQDLFVMGLPYMVTAAIAAIALALMCYPTLKLLLYAAVPTEYQTWYLFCILLLEECRFLIILISISTPVWALQVISFDLLNGQLQRLINFMQITPAHSKSFKYVYKSLRHFQVYVGIVNLINCFVVFSWKVTSITICIVTGYAAIAHFSQYPLFGVMYYVILLDCSFIYLLSYGKAFKIPALFEKATRTALLHMHKDKSEASKIFRLQIQSIPRLGIKVGEFHLMERESTLIFIHYVLNNIVAMLVANGHG